MATPKFERDTFFQSAGVDNSAAQAATGLAQAFGNLADTTLKVGREHERREQKEIQDQIPAEILAGRKAGAEGKSELKEGTDPLAKAYNKGAVQGYSSEIKRDARSRISELAVEFENDPVGFQSSANAYMKGTLEELPDEIAVPLREQLSDLVGRNSTVLNANMLKKERDQNDANILEEIETQQDDISILARSGGDVKASQAAYNREVDASVKSGATSADQARRLKESMRETITQESFLGGVENSLADGGVKEAQKFLNNKEEYKDLNAQQTATLKARGQSLINKKQAQITALENQRKREATEMVAQYEKAMTLGFKVDPAETAKVNELTEGFPKLQDRVVFSEQLRAFSFKNVEERSADIAEFSKGNLDDVGKMSQALSTNATINKMAQDDAYDLGVKQGLIQEITFDPSDPLSLQLKIDQAETLSFHYGVQASPFSNAEVSALSASIQVMTVPEKVQLAQTLTDAPQVWGQLDSKNASLFAMAGATGDSTVQSAIFTGQEMIRDKLVIKPKAQDYIPVLDDLVGDVYNVDNKTAITKAALAHYAATSGDDGEFDPEAFETSIQAVTGGVGSVNGGKVELPRGITEGTFDNYIDDFTPAGLEALGGVFGMSGEDAIEIMESGRIQSIKSGEYIVTHTNGTLMSAKDPSKPFVINYNIDIDSLNKTGKATQSLIDTEKAIGKMRGF